MSCVFRWLAGVFLALCSVQSWAVVPMGTEYQVSAAGSNGGWFSTREAACAGLSAVLHARNPDWSANVEGDKCRVWTPSGSLYGYATRAACPSNSTASGSACTCNAGFDEQNGQCVSPQICNGISQICKDAQGVESIWGGKSPLSGTSCFPVPGDEYKACTSGCSGTVGMSVSTTTAAGGTTYGGSMKYTGMACNLPPNSTDGPKKTDCIGDKGTVGGKEVCIPPTNATGDKQSSTRQNADGSVVNRESTTTCSDGKCTTTTTTTTTKPDGSTSSSSSSSTTSQTDYCSKNPGSQVCSAVNKGAPPGSGSGGGGSNPGSGTGSGSGSGSGSGTGGGTGEGEEKGTCGVEGKPACKVKVDETGVKDKFEGDTKSLDDWKSTVEANRDQMKGAGDGIFDGLRMFWSAPPLAACTPLVLPDGKGMITQQCDVVDGVRDAMYYIWALGAIWICLGWIREAV